MAGRAASRCDASGRCPRPASGECAQLLVDGRAGQAVGQGGKRVGADPEDHLEGVAPGEAVAEELRQGRVTDIARRVEGPEGEGADRAEPRVLQGGGRPEGGGQGRVPATYLLPAAGWRLGWGAQHSDEPYSLFAHYGVKTVVPATPTDAYGLFVSAIRDDDPVVLFAPIAALPLRDDVEPADLVPVPLGSGRVHREGSDVTVVAIGHLVHDALAVASQLADQVSIEVFDPRTLYPFDWDGLAASLDKTGRLVVIDDSNRTCGMAGEIIATAVEEMHLVAPPRRITRPDAAVLGYSPEVDLTLQPSRQQLVDTVLEMAKS